MYPCDQSKSRHREVEDALNLAFNLPAKIGAAIFIASAIVILSILVGFLYYDNQWREHLSYLVFGFLIIFGPIFVGVAWVTRRTLRRFQNYRKKRKV